MLGEVGYGGAGTKGPLSLLSQLQASTGPVGDRDSAGPAWTIQPPKRAGQTLFTFSPLLPDTIPTPTYVDIPSDPGSPSVQRLAKFESCNVVSLGGLECAVFPVSNDHSFEETR